MGMNGVCVNMYIYIFYFFECLLRVCARVYMHVCEHGHRLEKFFTADLLKIQTYALLFNVSSFMS